MHRIQVKLIVPSPKYGDTGDVIDLEDKIANALICSGIAESMMMNHPLPIAEPATTARRIESVGTTIVAPAPVETLTNEGDEHDQPGSERSNRAEDGTMVDQG